MRTYRLFTIGFATLFAAAYAFGMMDKFNWWLILSWWQIPLLFLMFIVGGLTGMMIDKRVARKDAREEADETFRQMQEVLGKSAVAAIHGYIAASELERVPMEPDLQLFARAGLRYLAQAAKNPSPMNGDAEKARKDRDTLRAGLLHLGKPELAWVQFYEGVEVHLSLPNTKRARATNPGQ